MNKNEILKILEDWNFWEKDAEMGIPRPFYLEKFKEMLPAEQIIAVTGARRSGKSFLMRQAAGALVAEGVDKKRILAVNFEDPRFVGLNTELLGQVYDAYFEFLKPDGKPYLFLDEIQEIPEWEKWVRTTQELKRAAIVLSGSNAKLLSRELSTLLAGRHLDITVFPLSFGEFLDFRGIRPRGAEDIAAKGLEFRGLLGEYIKFGSFPEVVLREAKEEILLAYFRDILNKDLIQRYGIRKSEKFKGLVKFYLSNISSPVTFNSLHKSLGISTDTVEKFSGYLETAYLVFFLKRFSFKVREQEKSPRKVYAIDTGLSNVVGFRFSQNIGRLAENIVFLELKRREADSFGAELYYWKDDRQREVDFVVKDELKVRKLIQVCWDIGSAETKKREISSLTKAMGDFGLDEGLVITEDHEGEEMLDGKKIKYLPLWKWLLAE